jgi:hypothetical protein
MLGSMGTIALVHAFSALNVSNPIEGGQSISMYWYESLSVAKLFLSRSSRPNTPESFCSVALRITCEGTKKKFLPVL